MGEGRVFSRRAVAVLLGLSIFSFGLGLFLTIFSPELTPESKGADVFGRSAVGHRAFLQVLRGLDFDVLVTRYDSLSRTEADDLLILAEPDMGGGLSEMVEDWAWEDVTRLVVLPKWVAGQDPVDEHTVEWVSLVTESEVSAVAREIGLTDVQVIRPEALGGWFLGGFDVVPELPYAPQLIRSGDLRPIISTREGVLLGEYYRSYGNSLWILSDPDLLANHGLGRGDNAYLAASIVDRLVDGGGVVFDAATQGHGAKPTLWSALFRPPLVLVTIEVAVLLAFLLWLTMRRFGPPEPPPPPLEAGKAFLIDNTAQLLHFGGHTAHGLTRYYRVVLQIVGKRLHVPADRPQAELLEFLVREGERRNVSIRLRTLDTHFNKLAVQSRIPQRVALSAARRLHQWKREMVDGAAASQSDK